MTDLHRYKAQHPGIRADYTIDQNWASYTREEHGIWQLLYRRQAVILERRASSAFLGGLKKLNLGEAGIPDFRSLNDELHRLTGWTVVAVPGLVPDAIFFEHLANRRFPAGYFIRRPEQIDYIEEPDIFHDVYGHVPMLADPIFADYMEAYGKGGLRALGLHHLNHLARLYWYTVEFGLIREAGALRIFGSGIVSSKGESVFALDDPSPNRVHFDLVRTMRTKYRIDDFQETYFVIDSFDELYHATVDPDFAPIYRRLEALPDLEPGALDERDRIYWRGTGDYAQSRRQRSA